MPNTEEQRLDIIENCNILLNTVLHRFSQTNDTPEGRMISQLKWLKERAENHDLLLPVNPDMLSTLRRVYVDGELCRYASSHDKVHEEVEIYMDRLLSLTLEAKLLLKPHYYPHAIRFIEALLKLLQTAHRSLDQYEQGSIAELEELKLLLTKGGIELPLASFFPNYRNFRKVYSLAGNSTDNLPNGKFLTNTVASLLFEGVRPDTWVTPELADKDTAGL